MASDALPTTAEPLPHKAFAVPAWMKRGEKRTFRSIIRERLEAKEQPSAAEMDRIADYIAMRSRITLLRDMLAKDEAKRSSGCDFTDLKARILQTSRQLDAAEKQSHQLATDLGLI